MSNNITRIIFRRGVESDRSLVTLLQGEPGFTIDSSRLYVGDGTTRGGLPVGIRNLGFVAFGPTFSNVSSLLAPASGDIVYDTTSNYVYALTGRDFSLTSNYRRFGTSITVDGTTIQNDNGVISVRGSSLNAGYFTSAAIGQGLERTSGDTVLRIPTPSPELSFTGNQLQITNGGITNAKLATALPDTVKGRLTTAGTPGDVPLATLAAALAPLLTSPVVSIPTGTVLDFAGNTAPTGYLICNGAAVSRTTFSTLFGVIGTTWGSGDGSTTFNVPDLRGRTSMGSGQGASLTNRTVGQTLGAEQHILTIEEMPAHSHTIGNNTSSDIAGTTGLRTVGATTIQTNLNTNSTGGSTSFGNTVPHNNIQPSVVVTKIIKT